MSLVLSGITIVVAVACGFHILNIMFTAIFGAIAYVVGAGIAGFALFLVQYVMIVGVFGFIWLNIINPKLIVYPVASFFTLLFTNPRKFFVGIWKTMVLSVETLWLKIKLLTVKS